MPRWTQSRGEELANTISHGIGLVAALIATPVLLLAARNAGSGGFFVGTIIFALTMLVLYLGSTLYHAWPQTRAKCVLQVFDHSAIFLLIAGTVHAIHARSTPWGMGLDHARTDLGPGDLRHNYESDAGGVAPSKTGVIALSRDGLVAAHRNPAAGLCHSATRIVLVNCGRNRLYDGSAIFR